MSYGAVLGKWQEPSENEEWLTSRPKPESRVPRWWEHSPIWIREGVGDESLTTPASPISRHRWNPAFYPLFSPLPSNPPIYSKVTCSPGVNALCYGAQLKERQKIEFSFLFESWHLFCREHRLMSFSSCFEYFKKLLSDITGLHFFLV